MDTNKNKTSMKKVADWRIFEFLKEDNGHFSSTRLFALSIIASAIIEWQKAVWTSVDGIWHPDYATVGLIAGVLGVKVLQKGVEKKASDKQESGSSEPLDLFGKGTAESETKTEPSS